MLNHFYSDRCCFSPQFTTEGFASEEKAAEIEVWYSRKGVLFLLAQNTFALHFWMYKYCYWLKMHICRLQNWPETG